VAGANHANDAGSAGGTEGLGRAADETDKEGRMSNAFPHLANPWWLLLLIALPVLAWNHHRRQGFGALTYSRLPLPLRRSSASSESVAAPGAPLHNLGAGRLRLHLPFYLRLAGLAALILAMARPQLGYAWEESLTEGIDIELALDISGSMAAEDFQPQNRLAVAKQTVKQFVAGRTGDRIGLVVFSGSALTRSPLTTDHAMLGLLVDSVELNSLPDGTAIGVALASAAARLKDSPAKTRIVVLVTDGGNNAGEIDPISAAAICKGLGLKVYTIGVGTAGRVPVPVPMRNPETGAIEYHRQLMNVAVDEELLRQIARRTGGLYFKATDQQSLQHIFGDIDRLEKTPLKVKRYVRYREAFTAVALAGLALLVLPLAGAALQVTAEP
jgi:Ca-activated chloride channel family protein